MREEYLQRAYRLMAKTPLIDGHNDFPFIIRGLYQNQVEAEGCDFDHLPIGQTDFTRLKEGHLGGQFWSAFIPCAKPRDNAMSSDRVVIETLQQIDLIHSLIEKYPHSTADEIWRVFQSGRVASLIGVEGLHQIAGSVSVLRMYHRLGVRYITLTHNCDNQYATSSCSTVQTGLSDDGKHILQEMNRIGMMVDLSHTNNITQLDVLRISKAPVIFSHSSCMGVTAVPRNVSDEVLDLLQQNDGVIMVCFLPDLVAPKSQALEPKQTATVSHVADHILYVVDRIGFAHVGIGSDFDGMLLGPQDLDDVSQYPNLISELLRRGLSEDHVQGILGLNIIRVLQTVEQTARQIRLSDGIAMHYDEIPVMWTPEQQSLLRQAGEGRIRK